MASTEQIGRYVRYQLSKEEMRAIAYEAVRYALISSPFTINRMHINDLDKRILNITKGKISEMLFAQFVDDHKLSFDFKSCSTPFYQGDKRDFLFNELEWDQKNNFLSRQSLYLKEEELDELPALIPNKFTGDQWDRRTKLHFQHTKGAGFVFSFMFNKLENGPLVTDFLTISLSKEWKTWLVSLGKSFQGKTQKKAPFTKDWFWEESEKRVLPWDSQTVQLNFASPIYITSYATQNDWSHFRPLSPSSFAEGKMKIRIKNQGCKIAKLPSFSDFIHS